MESFPSRWGWMILKGWPLSGVWAIGILVGVRLLFAGMTMLTLGSAGNQLAKDQTDPTNIS